MKHTNDGIRCDFCAIEKIGDFVYFSLDIREVNVADNKFPVHIIREPVIFSIDACLPCMERLGEIVKLHYVPTLIGMNCDICGGKMRGNFSFYYCLVTQVNVSMGHGQILCKECNSAMSADNKPCKCGSTKAKKIAEINIDDKFLQIMLCNKDYQDLVSKVVKTRQHLGKPMEVKHG